MDPHSETLARLLPLPSASFHALVALGEGDVHGYGIRQRVEALTDGAVRIPPGTLYETLHRMQAQGLVEESDLRPPPDEDHSQRTYYRLTSLGRAALRAEVARMGSVVDHARRLLREGPA